MRNVLQIQIQFMTFWTRFIIYIAIVLISANCEYVLLIVFSIFMHVSLLLFLFLCLCSRA